MGATCSIDSKRVFRPPFSQMSTDLGETWQRSVVARNTYTCGFSFYPIGTWADPVQTKTIYNGPPHSRWQSQKRVGSGLCCREKFGNFLTWENPEPKTAVCPVPCTQPTEHVCLRISGTVGKRTFRRCAFGVSTHQMSRIPNGRTSNPQEYCVQEV